MGSTGYQPAARKPPSRLATLGFWLGVLALLCLLLAGPGYRLHLWTLRVGLMVLIPAAVFLGIAAVILSLAGLVRAGGRGRALLGLVLGIIAAGIPVYDINLAKHCPIHDVSTDTTNPPQFSAVLPLRVPRPGEKINPVTYDEKTAELQRQTYPDIAPLHLDLPPAQALDRALATARNMKWEIVSSDPARGRFEATATTLWFGFKDDIAVRITPEGSGSRVDVRSLSRIGESDVSANARRIRKYLDKLKAA